MSAIDLPKLVAKATSGLSPAEESKLFAEVANAAVKP